MSSFLKFTFIDFFLLIGSRSPFVPSLSRVPDSCCIKERPGCGQKAFEDDDNPSAVIG